MSTYTSLPLPAGCASRCPACAHRGMSAGQSQDRKQAWLQDTLAPWQDRLSPIQCVPPEQRWHYRDKVCLRCQWTQEGWQAGVMRHDELIPIPACPVHSHRVNAALAALLPVLPEADGFPLYYWAQNGAQLTLVVKTARLPPTDWLTPAIVDTLAGIGLEGLWLHAYPCAGRNTFAKTGWQLAWGNARSVTPQGILYGPSSFQQVLPRLYAASLQEADRHLRAQAHSTVVDLYCGNGRSLQCWQARQAPCIGIELGAEAVACARRNAPGVEVLRGRCAQRIPQLDHWLGRHPAGEYERLLYANPPRTGLEPEVRYWIAHGLRPARMAYLSCSAGTLRRDLDELCRQGYRVDRITPYDFFPHTYHVETLALLSYAPGSRNPATGLP